MNDEELIDSLKGTDLYYSINRTKKNLNILHPQYNDYIQDLAIDSFYISKETK